MRTPYGWCVGLLLVVTSTGAAGPKGRIVQETWDAAYLGRDKAGYVHTVVREVEQGGQKLRRTTLELDLTVRRAQDLAHLRMVTGTDETEDGKVTAVSMRQFLGKEQDLVLTGTVEGDQLHVKVAGKMELDKKVPWNDQVIGLYREQNLFKDRAVKPGDKFAYLHYEPSISLVVTVRVAVKDYEEFQVKGGKRRLLRVDAVPDKIEDVQLPPTSLWLDEDLQPVRSEVEMPGLGKLILVRTTEKIALDQPNTAKAPEILLTTLIRLNQRIPDPHQANSVVYRISLPKDDKPSTAFAQDNRQSVRNVSGHTFELVVRAIRKPEPNDKPEEVAEEYLKSNYFINSADRLVRQHALQAVGKETDPWRKAQRIERWVHRNMKSLNFSEAMATADHVARTLEGDCSEFSMLAAAMCRAVDVPSRIAMGLVYVDHRQHGPVLGYHMWTEVWVNGQWIAIDATLGQGSVGAAHLKITDHSWNVQSLKPLLPVMRVMSGQVAVDVVSVNEVD
ncbi:MAG TPA: transglutaminase-like domain-containing protein [Gemmataceae bacterium]|nr:transglutaminase-like domain-containing protein [Gemmataceae bacterium]